MRTCISKNNKKIKLIAFSAIFIIVFLLITGMISCTATGSSDNTNSNNSVQNTAQNGSTDNTGDIQEETINSVEGEDLTNYDNVKIGAEIKGAIPGFLTTNKYNYV
ncbi:hypothetical protein LLG07_08210, partial [bacterium]|nr:hypothetical protein [bacterium]